MKHQLKLLATVIGAGAIAISGEASAAQIMLAPANVIGSAGDYGGFPADNILDQQTGAVNDVAGSTYWLWPDSNGNPAFITIDLGASYRIGELELFNTRNDFFGDRGTKDFTIAGGNSVSAFSGGLRLSGLETTLVTGVLAPAAVINNIPGQSFSVSSSATFRYLEFRPTSARGPFSTASFSAYGLNELRVYEYEATGAIPEPSTWAMMILGFGAAGAAIRSRRRVSAAAA
ncbi:PEPxxWA-CTERM sorting domain-containing protein [Phenylobacterium sp.]|jgi:hypothetical protein|uniref:PEPxxWA-CTERM sorting domain-containing protein n=1 Tax=Phenylobacterium sp. TaxID=1871053 RepID=UPI0037C7DB00